jgi:hypothetical protein
MKVNEAPKEIYLLPDDRNPNGLSICWYEAPYETGSIEYTRTDAFIEKIESFLNRKNDRDSYTIGYIKRHLKEIIKEVGL